MYCTAVRSSRNCNAMLQEILNRCVLIDTYTNEVDGLDSDDLMREFVNSDKRILVCGDALVQTKG